MCDRTVISLMMMLLLWPVNSHRHKFSAELFSRISANIILDVILSKMFQGDTLYKFTYLLTY